jgi:hypothetical protein
MGDTFLKSISHPMTMVEQGEISYYRYDDPSFTGADLVIKNRGIWEWFWAIHNAGREPQPSLPDIDFSKEMVIAAILGTQRSGGGPPGTQVLEINTDEGGNCLHVLIQDNYEEGKISTPVITNPFHIVRLETLQGSSVVFEHQKQPEE